MSGGELRAIKADAGGDRLMACEPVLSRRSWIGLAGAAAAGALAGCGLPARTPTSASLSGAPWRGGPNSDHRRGGGAV